MLIIIRPLDSDRWIIDALLIITRGGGLMSLLRVLRIGCRRRWCRPARGTKCHLGRAWSYKDVVSKPVRSSRKSVSHTYRPLVARHDRICIFACSCLYPDSAARTKNGNSDDVKAKIQNVSEYDLKPGITRLCLQRGWVCAWR